MSNVGLLSSTRRQFWIVPSRLSSRLFTPSTIRRTSPPGCQMPFLLVSICEQALLKMIWPESELGAIIGQVLVGLICDRMGRKVALVGTTLLIVLGATLGTAAHGAHGSPAGLFWFLTIARGITGVVSHPHLRTCLCH